MQAELDFSGATYDRERDGARLFAQLEDVRRYMADGEWRSLAEITHATGHPQASVSARLRDLRKARWGSHTVERQFVVRGLWRYRLVR